MFDVLNDDYLMIFDGGDKTGKALHTGKGFGGTTRPPSTIVAQNGKIHLVFLTNPVRAGLGWNITFSTSKFLFLYFFVHGLARSDTFRALNTDAF
jgi:hypothetical protein